MRHINAQNLDILNKPDSNGMQFVGRVSDCDVCAVGKGTQRAPSEVRNTNLNVSNKLWLVYADGIGSCSPTAPGGTEHVSKITDEIPSGQKYSSG